MTTYHLGQPTELRHRMERDLPRSDGHPAAVKVTPRDRAERKCPAYDADHYEVQAYYTTMRLGLLEVLEDAVRATPGVYLTTQVWPTPGGPHFTCKAWPAPLGSARRDRDLLRAQVIALIRDPGQPGR